MGPREPNEARGRWGPGFDRLLAQVRRQPSPVAPAVAVADPPPGLLDWLSRCGLPVTGFPLCPVAPPIEDRDARHREAIPLAPEPWPFAAESLDAVVLVDVLEHVIDDQGALREAGRALRPGGLVLIRVPYRGPVAWLDPANVYRYVSDATRRGPNPPETWGIGWRRHYSRRELTGLLRASGFTVTDAAGTGLGLAPALDLALMLLFRWLLPWEPVYQRTLPLTEVVERLERRLAFGPLGYWLTLVAYRDDLAPAAKAPTR